MIVSTVLYFIIQIALYHCTKNWYRICTFYTPHPYPRNLSDFQIIIRSFCVGIWVKYQIIFLLIINFVSRIKFNSSQPLSSSWGFFFKDTYCSFLLHLHKTGEVLTSKRPIRLSITKKINKKVINLTDRPYFCMRDLQTYIFFFAWYELWLFEYLIDINILELYCLISINNTLPSVSVYIKLKEVISLDVTGHMTPKTRRLHINKHTFLQHQAWSELEKKVRNNLASEASR